MHMKGFSKINNMVSKWITKRVLKSEDYKIFNLSLLTKEHPVRNKESNFVVINSSDWVNIIPITTDNRIVLIEQYRHGTDEITLEIPGGLVEIGEEPRLAAERECIEETGFSSDIKSELIGYTHPNPAFLNNQCYSYLWKNCEKKQLQNLDGNEEINVVYADFNEIKNYIETGKISHSLVLNAFFFYFNKYGY